MSILSIIAGYISIGCWLIVFTPQLYTNFQRKSGDALSIHFLVVWLIGDVFNVAGAILKGLLLTVILLGLYYALADILLLIQYYYYHDKKITDEIVDIENDIETLDESRPLLKEEKNHHLSEEEKVQEEVEIKEEQIRFNLGKYITIGLIVFVILLNVFVGWWVTQNANKTKNNHHDHSDHSNINQSLKLKYLVADIMGWISACLYIGSRFPQLIHNFQNKSVDGLSIWMFFFSVVGNVRYCLSIFLESMHKKYLMENLPWLTGSGGTLFLDILIFGQFFWYTRRRSLQTLRDKNDNESKNGNDDKVKE